MKLISAFLTLFAAMASVESTKVISFSETPLRPNGESLRASDDSVTIGDTTFRFMDIDTNSQIDPNLELSLDDEITVNLNYQWGLDRIDQPKLPLDKKEYVPAYSGRGVDIYVVDTGVDTQHPEFEDRASYGTHLTGSKGDVHGHGTHVGSTVAGVSVGVAPGSNIIDVKVLGDSGSGSTSGVIRGVAWAVENSKKTGKCSIVSMSLGGTKNAALNKAVEEAYKQGVLVVVAAGNSNQDARNYSPASEETALTVGSTTNTDTRSYFSNYGSLVDIFAPGSSILGAKANTKNYVSLSGTSMACPHVSGAAALLMEEHGCSNLNKITNLLLESTLKGEIRGIPQGTSNRFLQVESGTKGPTPAPTCPSCDKTCKETCESMKKKRDCRAVRNVMDNCRCRWRGNKKDCVEK